MEKRLTNKKRAELDALNRKKRRRIILIAIGAAVLAAALILGLILLLNAPKTVLRVGGIEVKEDLYAYFLSYGKYNYLKETRGSDTPSFWASSAGDGKTHEAACREYAERYMRETVAAASLFEQLGGSLTEAEREALTKRHKELADQFEISSKRDFNRLSEKLGFSYSTLRKALLYEKEAELLSSLLVLKDTDVDRYYREQYRHVLIIEVRTVNRYIMDEEGDLEQDLTTGDYLLHTLTEAERAEARAKIERIRGSLTENGSLNNFMALQAEAGLNEDINILRGRYTDGYFFAPSSDFKDHFQNGLPAGSDNVAAGIFGQEKGSWHMYNAVNSVLFVYVTGGTADGDRPYEDKANEDFFHDIRSGAVAWLYGSEVSRKADTVKIDRSRADAFDLVKMGTNPLLYTH